MTTEILNMAQELITVTLSQIDVKGSSHISSVKYVVNTLFEKSYLTSISNVDPDFDDDYRFGFNGQEKTNEIAGTGNHNTALFWEYDTRLGRRWNLDPVVKPWRSSYDAFSNNPLLKIDPQGDDDYYNEKGQFVGRDGKKTTNMRFITSQVVGVLELTHGNNLWNSKVGAVNDMLGVASVNINVDISPSELNGMMNDSHSESPIGLKGPNRRREQAALVVFDLSNLKSPTIRLERLPDTDNTHDQSGDPTQNFLDPDNQRSQLSYGPEKSPKGHLVLGNIHTHPNKISEGYFTNIEGNNGKDGRQARIDGKPNYNLYNNKIDFHSPVSSAESKNNLLKPNDGIGLGKHALKSYGAPQNRKGNGSNKR